jgi:integrase
LKRLADTLRSVEQKGLDWKLTSGLDPSRAKHRARAETQKIEVSPFVLAAIRLLLFTGCRLGEIMNLRWSEVDFERGVLNLADSKTGKKSVILNGSAIAILSELPRVGAYVISGQDPPRALALRGSGIVFVSWRVSTGAMENQRSGSTTSGTVSLQSALAVAWDCRLLASSWATRNLRPRVGTRIWMRIPLVERVISLRQRLPARWVRTWPRGQLKLWLL